MPWPESSSWPPSRSSCCYLLMAMAVKHRAARTSGASWSVSASTRRLQGARAAHHPAVRRHHASWWTCASRWWTCHHRRSSPRTTWWSRSTPWCSTSPPTPSACCTTWPASCSAVTKLAQTNLRNLVGDHPARRGPDVSRSRSTLALRARSSTTPPTSGACGSSGWRSSASIHRRTSCRPCTSR